MHSEVGRSFYLSTIEHIVCFEDKLEQIRKLKHSCDTHHDQVLGMVLHHHLPDYCRIEYSYSFCYNSCCKAIINFLIAAKERCEIRIGVDFLILLYDKCNVKVQGGDLPNAYPLSHRATCITFVLF